MQNSTMENPNLCQLYEIILSSLLSEYKNNSNSLIHQGIDIFIFITYLLHIIDWPDR